jgi:hypothetical protein
MHRSAVFLFSLLAVAFPIQAFAQTVQRDSQAVAVLAQAQAAMGAATAPVADTVAIGNVAYWDGRTGTVRIETKGIGRLRFETTLDGKTNTVVVSAGRGYSLEGATRRKLPVWVTQYLRVEHLPALSRIADYLQPNTKLAYLGVETVSGRAAHHIRISAAPTDNTPADIEDLISEFHVFVDCESLQVLKTITFDFSPEIIENRSQVETYYSDYRDIGGLLVPFRVTRYVSGQLFSETTFTSIATNVGVPDGDFQ